MLNWRFDQGRLDYFNFDNIKAFAECFVDVDGTPVGSNVPDLLRECMTAKTGLLFPPENAPEYYVWRNFARIFRFCLLAVEVDKTLVVTDICKRLASKTNYVDADQYFTFLVPRLYCSSPALSHKQYIYNEKQYFPYCAVLKYLFASYHKKQQSISIDDILSYIIGNDCSGLEPIGYYENLAPTGYILQGDAKSQTTQRRQIREALIFISQSSFLEMEGDELFLDVLSGDNESMRAFEQMLEPFVQQRLADRDQEVINLGKYDATLPVEISKAKAIDTARQEPADVVFTEGNRVRVTHLRTERSPMLRRAFFANLSKPYLCDMCGCDPKRTYHWTDNILEVHHVLPLSSTLLVTETGTSLRDVVGLCPNCHESVHFYYKRWLNDKKVVDFSSRNQARDVYQEARGQVRL